MKDLNTIYLEDCVTFMKSLKKETVDLIIADPPYNLNKNFGNKSDQWDDVNSWLNWSKKWINESIRILKPTGSIFIYGIHHYLCYIHCYLYQKNLKYQRQIIWHYENGFSGYKTLNAFYEPILWFTKSDNFTYHEIREPYKSQERIKNKITKNGKVWTPNPEGRLAGDIWYFPTLAGKRFAKERTLHPTQKPLDLCDRLVKHFSNQGDLIYVPFAGSGSECISCISQNRNFIATEINPEYIKVANQRISSYR
ncbi:MAG: site-specific DNA-methyltransferase [Gudongella sp.]|nr:site-specific DNA-methyltransferase [Gudongella sp.]